MATLIFVNQQNEVTLVLHTGDELVQSFTQSAHIVQAEENTPVLVGWNYDPSSGEFSAPAE